MTGVPSSHIKSQACIFKSFGSRREGILLPLTSYKPFSLTSETRFSVRGMKTWGEATHANMTLVSGYFHITLIPRPLTSCFPVWNYWFLHRKSLGMRLKESSEKDWRLKSSPVWSQPSGFFMSAKPTYIADSGLFQLFTELTILFIDSASLKF